jgi:hypothetical protein
MVTPAPAFIVIERRDLENLVRTGVGHITIAKRIGGYPYGGVDCRIV